MSCSRYTRCLGTRARKLCTSGKTAAHWQAGRQTDTHQGLMASPCVSPAGQPAATAECRPLLVRPFCRASTPQSLPSAEESGRIEYVSRKASPGRTRPCRWRSLGSSSSKAEVTPKLLLPTQAWALQRPRCSRGGWRPFGIYPAKANRVPGTRQFCSLRCFRSLEESSVFWFHIGGPYVCV